MAPTDPLEIQEIIDLVALYVERNDLTACIRVSKSWRDTFLPHIWRIVRAGLHQFHHGNYDDNYDNYGNYGNYSFYGRYGDFGNQARYGDQGIQSHYGNKGILGVAGPTWNAIDNHLHLIEELTLVKMDDGFNKDQYPNVRRLVIDMSISSLRHSQLFMNFTTKIPMLVDLTLRGGRVPSAFWIALSEHPHLEYLSLAHLKMRIKDKPRLWSMCMKLKSLQLKAVVLKMASRPPENMVFGRLRRLMFSGTLYPYFLDIAVQSPMLESLTWNAYYDWTSLERPLTATGNWPRLKKVCLTGWYEDTNMDLLFKRVENGIENSADVEEPYRSGLDTPQIPKAFGSHFDALVEVDIRAAKETSRSTVPDILCFCPRLEKLWAATVSARSVAERGPWVGQQHLRELQIQFTFEEGENHLQPLMFERLSTLVQLERLTLDYRLTEYTLGVGLLECRLEHGLGQLASLQRLKRLWFYTPSNCARDTHLGMKEVEWILNNCKQLEKVLGYLSMNSELRAQFQSAFESHGIRIAESFHSEWC